MIAVVLEYYLLSIYSHSQVQRQQWSKPVLAITLSKQFGSSYGIRKYKLYKNFRLIKHGRTYLIKSAPHRNI